jgi:hypothetical protein
MGLTARTHERIQSVIAWGGTLLALGSFYTIFLARYRTQPAGACGLLCT